jgi:hypothetical protein
LIGQYGIELIQMPLARYRVHGSQATANQGNVFRGYASLYGDLLHGRYGPTTPRTTRVIRTRYAHFLYLLGRVHARRGDFRLAVDTIRLSLGVDPAFLARNELGALRSRKLPWILKPYLKLILCALLSQLRSDSRQGPNQSTP